MQDNKNEKLIVDLRKKSSSELVEFLNTLLKVKQSLHSKGISVNIKRKVPNKISNPPPAHQKSDLHPTSSVV